MCGEAGAAALPNAQYGEISRRRVVYLAPPTSVIRRLQPGEQRRSAMNFSGIVSTGVPKSH
jgi:hypothetical protein